MEINNKQYYLFKEFFSADQVREMYEIYNELYTSGKIFSDDVPALFKERVLVPYGGPIAEALEPYYKFAQRKLEYYLDTILSPTYHIGRVYQGGINMRRHIDRACCEVSITFTIAHNKENWPIWVQDGDNPVEVRTPPGSVLLYSGDILPHWREVNTFNDIQYQHFMHWVDTSTEQGSLISLFDRTIRGSNETIPLNWDSLKTRNMVPVIDV